MNSNVVISNVSWAEAQQDLIAVRGAVFMQEQNISAADEWDGKDASASHLIARTLNGHPVGCARVLVETINNNACFHIGRVAVVKAYRNQGLGHRIVKAAIEWCQQHQPENPIFLHAQTDRIAFYQRLQFVAQGATFIDAGIPHIEMWYKNTK